MNDEKITKFSISNGLINDAGVVILCDFFEMKGNLKVLKLYNNIMYALLNGLEVPYLISGTYQLANCIDVN